MRRVLLAAASTTTGLVMLLGFKTHPVTSTPASALSTGGATTTAATTSSAPASTGSGSAASATGTRTVTGSSVDTRYGPVQVRITVSGTRVTAADAVVYPQDNPRDQEINTFAVPQLDSEAVAASSASIDTVSGATYTSEGYLQSLQSALDKAGL